MSHITGSTARQLALKRLGRLFALLDDAVTGGDLETAKSLLAEVRAALAVARETELGAVVLNTDDVEGR
jgi:hypothetical protein